MTNLLTRNVDSDLQRRLEESPQEHGRSLSDEAKALLLKALPTEPNRRKLGTLMRELLPLEHRSDDYVFEIHGEVRRPPDFE